MSDTLLTIPGARRLGDGRYTVILTPAGAGGAARGALALTRWTPDRTREGDGAWLYLRDVDAGTRWAATRQPISGAPARYAARFGAALAEFEREEDGIVSTLEVCVPGSDDVELRRLTIANRGGRARRVEITSYAEVVLNTPGADWGHPAFAKLFVQTAWLPERQALLAWRRLRSPHDEPLCLAHALAPEGGTSRVQWETDRMRFLGRGRGPADPRALDHDAPPLSGTTGNVLDPVLALRRMVELAPGATARLASVYAAAASREEAEALVARWCDAARVDEALRAARDGGALAEAWLDGAEPPSAFRPADPAEHPNTPDAATEGIAAAESLRQFNGHGGFSEDGREYVVHLPAGMHGPERPPLPWANVIANESAGVIVSESGAAYTWAANSRENRLTPWLNDPVSDPHGEALWLRDEMGGVFWSPTPGPTPAPGPYEARHGFGYSQWRHESYGLAQETTILVPRHDPVRIVRLRVENRSGRARRLSAFAYAHLVLGVNAHETAASVRTERDAGTGALLAANEQRGEFSARVAFASAVATTAGGEVRCTGDRTAFLGPRGRVAAPAALRSAAPLDGRTGAGLDPCAAFQLAFELAPGESAEVAFLLGEANDADGAREIVRRYVDHASIERALEEVSSFWRELLDGVRIETPEPALDLVVNGWLGYQNLSCRMWGRSAFYQSGGAYGFRDQLQDAAALVYLMPELTRAQIVLHAAHQFVEGDVLHWWHPPLSKGMRTRFSDDLLWLPYIAAGYIAATGDASVLDEPARFVAAPPLEPGEDEVFLVPSDSGTGGTVYEHARRAIDRSLTSGAHGLPLMGVGDWNDGMNRVGREGKGESVWLGFFLYHILGDWIGIAEERREADDAARWRDHRTRLRAALNDGGWDGGWYRRAYYDDGAPLGSRESDECRIDAIAQAWSVISGAAPADRAAQALDAMEEHLVSEREGIIRLLTPAFDRTPHDPGYIKGYLPGVRENGGQYTHGALWAVRALAEHGRRERAARLLAMLSPVHQGGTRAAVERYMTEPYVIAADVYGVEPHVGRGGWTWYTGSAGWMMRVALESVLGFTVRAGREIVLRPCVPKAWPGFTLRWRVPAALSADGAAGCTSYEIVVRRGAARGETRARLDGVAAEVRDGAVVVPIAHDGAAHRLTVELGDDVGPRYTPR